ncbi:AraC family transcriptional regulator [Tenacibaculum sp. 190524A02b]|uniref:AraC family transcriptional regulator n=1 Tax=Tenacibaculum vairaonense TaxID=3137860 RepID=A0ABM9PHM6_9FLAO
MALKNIPCLFLFLFLICPKLFSQNEKELNILKKTLKYKNNNPDSLIILSRELQKSNDQCMVIDGLSNEAYGFYRKKDYEKSREASLRLIDYANKLLEGNIIEDCYINSKVSGYNRLFWIEKNKENYKKAYEYIVQMTNTNEKYKATNPNYPRHKITIALSKALVKRKLQFLEESKSILLKAYKECTSPLFEKLEKDYFFKQQKAHILNSLGNSYFSLYKKNNLSSDLDSASYYYDKAYLVTKTFTPKHKDSKILYHIKKTEVAIAGKNYNEALNLINNYKNICNDFNYYHYEFFQKAICFYNLKQQDSTIHYANKLLRGHKRKNCKRSNLITIYDILSNQYNTMNKLDSAFKYSKLTMKQYGLAEKNKEKTYQLLYENDYKKAQKLNHEIITQESKKQNSIIAFFIGVISILSLFMYYKIKKEKSKKISLIKEFNAKESKTQQVSTPTKKEYNIGIELENQIINEIERINNTLAFLDANFSINTISDNINTNSTYVSFVFNKKYNEPFKQYYTKLRINYIIEKLKSDTTYRKYAIQALAEEVGYTNASAFTRAFKKQVGLTPSAFLKSLDS